MENGYSAAQASRLTGCSQRQITYWDEIALVTPSVRESRHRLYAFGDLVALRVVRSLLDGGMTLRQVRRAFEYLRERADLGDREALLGVKLVTDGRTIFEICRSDGEILDALRRGQLALFVAIDEINRGVEEGVREFLAEREAFVANLAGPTACDATETGARGEATPVPGSGARAGSA